MGGPQPLGRARQRRQALVRLADELVHDYGDLLAVGSIMRCLAASAMQHNAWSDSRTDVLQRVESVARSRLERRICGRSVVPEPAA